jgi:sugar lactone lactonase YvrE
MNRSSFRHEIAPTCVEMECVADAKSIVGESPLWSAAEQCVYFVDIPQRQLHRLSLSNMLLESFTTPDIVTAVALRRGGGLILTFERTLAFFDPGKKSFAATMAMTTEPTGNRFNDGKCDRQGRFWSGTMCKTEWDEPCGSLYRIGADRTATRLVSGIRCSNGLGWSPDSRTFYFAESFAHTIYAFDFEAQSGVISGRRVFATLDPASGAFPDGLTVDAEGHVWNAQPVFGRLVRYDPDGRIDRIVETPVSRCTSCTFGGDDLGTMYVTSARDSLTAEELIEEPLAGGLFAFRPGVTGIAETPFIG